MIRLLWRWPRRESNLDLELRRLLYYPLYYEAMKKEKSFKSLLADHQSGCIGGKYFYRNGQQNYTKKFTHR